MHFYFFVLNKINLLSKKKIVVYILQIVFEKNELTKTSQQRYVKKFDDEKMIQQRLFIVMIDSL